MINSVEWNKNLPLAQLSKSIKKDTGFIVDNPSIGPAFFRKLTDDLKHEISLTWVMTRSQARVFDLYYKFKLDNGNKWFKMPLRINGSGIQMQELHFLEAPTPTVNGNIVTYQARVIANEIVDDNDQYVDIILDNPDTFAILDRICNFDTWVDRTIISVDLITNFDAWRA